MECPIVLSSSFVVIAGDLNTNVLDESVTSVNNYISCLYSKNFLPAITKPTQFSQIEGVLPSSLDDIWINNLRPFASGIITNGITDHCSTYINFNSSCSVPLQENFKFTFRPYSKLYEENLISRLFNINWNSHLEWNNVNYKQKFFTLLCKYYCESFPLKTYIISGKRLSKPWLSNYLLHQIKRKSSYFKNYQNDLISSTTNKTFRNKVNKHITEAREWYWYNSIEGFKGRPQLDTYYAEKCDLLGQPK